MSDPVTQLKRAAKKHGLVVVKLSHHHYQIKGGPLLINYYPYSKQRSVYVGGTKTGFKNVTPKCAVEMAFKPPPYHACKAKRSCSSTNKVRRNKLWDKGVRECHWCHDPFHSIHQATLEHIVPLARGGLDNMNNLTLACRRCNNGRGSDMPELKNKAR